MLLFEEQTAKGHTERQNKVNHTCNLCLLRIEDEINNDTRKKDEIQEDFVEGILSQRLSKLTR